MILDKHSPLPDDPTPPDAPPSYETVVTATDNDHRRVSEKSDTKSPIIQQQESTSSSPTSPLSSLSPKPSVKKDKGKSRISNNWFSFNSLSSSRTNHEIRNTVQGLLRDVVQDHASNSLAAVGIITSCADACVTHDVSFSDLVQQQYIEQRTPLYWAIVKRLPDDHPEVEENQGPDLLTALISYASPLKEETIKEIRQACLATSDQNLFKRLGQSPGFARMSATDEVLLGVKIPVDEVEVEEFSSHEDAFAANFVIPQFHKRMAISKKISLEFIARGRLWRFIFSAAPEPKSLGDPPAGSWLVALSLQECSPPTHLDSRLLFLEATPSPSTPVSQPDSSEPPASAKPTSPTTPSSSSRLVSPSKRRSKSKQYIFVRLQTSYHQLEVAGKHSRGYQILESLEKDAAKLQYTNNPYIGADEKLRARFEARLGKPASTDKDCVIC